LPSTARPQTVAGYFMKHISRTIIAFLTVAAATAFAAGTKPSEASVRELLQLSGAPKMIDMSRGQLVGMATGVVQQALQGRTLTPEIKKIVSDNGAKVTALVNEALKWEAVEPMFIDIYQSQMTQEEVDGIVAFYRSPAGKALVEKMPAVMRASNQRMQQQLGPVMERVKQVQQETMLQLQAEFAKQP